MATWKRCGYGHFTIGICLGSHTLNQLLCTLSIYWSNVAVSYTDAFFLMTHLFSIFKSSSECNGAIE